LHKLLFLLFFCLALEKDGFGIRPFFEAFVAYSNELNQIVGFALYFFTYSTWVI
jgi:diamine N-acetyltransferase